MRSLGVFFLSLLISCFADDLLIINATGNVTLLNETESSPAPTFGGVLAPSLFPTTYEPSLRPDTDAPSYLPTTYIPTQFPSVSANLSSTSAPTDANGSLIIEMFPTYQPTNQPSVNDSNGSFPTLQPSPLSSKSTDEPFPTYQPTTNNTLPTSPPSLAFMSYQPTTNNTLPTSPPSLAHMDYQPTTNESFPSLQPSLGDQPTSSFEPTLNESFPSYQPTTNVSFLTPQTTPPSLHPGDEPFTSNAPTTADTIEEKMPTFSPTGDLSVDPSLGTNRSNRRKKKDDEASSLIWLWILICLIALALVAAFIAHFYFDLFGFRHKDEPPEDSIELRQSDILFNQDTETSNYDGPYRPFRHDDDPYDISHTNNPITLSTLM